MKILLCVPLILWCTLVYADQPRLMPLGDSITLGTGSTTGFGYRSALQDRLGIGVYDFVGSQKSPASDPTYDVDHNGISSQETAYIESIISARLDTYMPAPNPAGSKILLHIGTNDAWYEDVTSAQAVQNVSDILDIIQAHDASISVYVALIIPMDHAKNANVIAFNSSLRTMLYAYPKNNLYIVNMYAVFASNPNWITLWMSDFAHPNDTGYNVMAQAWANVILAPVVTTTINGTGTTTVSGAGVTSIR